jgi:hypothetical protein
MMTQMTDGRLRLVSFKVFRWLILMNLIMMNRVMI